jgi:hypothetical protein
MGGPWDLACLLVFSPLFIIHATVAIFARTLLPLQVGGGSI